MRSVETPELTVELDDGIYRVELVHEFGVPAPKYADPDAMDEIAGRMYAQSKGHDILFCDATKGDPVQFFMLFEDPRGVWSVIWQDDEEFPVGCFYLTNVIPHYDADAHFALWDSRLRGREPLAQAVIGAAFETYGLHRVTVEARKDHGALANFLKRVGFVDEGVRREAVLQDGEWFDMYRFGLLRSELTNGRQDEERDPARN